MMANRANNIPKIAAAEPSPPVLTGEQLAVIHMRGVAEMQRHGDVRLADLEAVHTVRAGGQHHGLLTVLRNNMDGNTGAMLTPGYEPIRALTTKGHQSVVIPYQRRSEPGIAEEQPAPTLTTRDRIALLVPAGGGWADKATPDFEPVPTQTTTTRAAVVAPTF